jgi:hypothetical protein
MFRPYSFKSIALWTAGSSRQSGILWRESAIHGTDGAATGRSCEHSSTRQWDSNDGEGLDAEKALGLAAALRVHLADGRTAAYCESRDKAVTEQNVREFAEFLEHCGGFTLD